MLPSEHEEVAFFYLNVPKSGLEGLEVIKISIVFRVMTLCNLVGGYQLFGETYLPSPFRMLI